MTDLLRTLETAEAGEPYVTISPVPRIKYGVPASAVLDGPWVQWKHCDGPCLHWAGNIDWLTWRERIAIFFGLKTVEEVARDRWPFMAEVADRLRAHQATNKGTDGE